MNMRQVVLDTETTGLEWQQGHRVIEVGAIEIVNRRRTGRTFHKYFCPDRLVDAGALQVHGITNEFLSSQPRFHELAAELIEFIADAELIIHNAAFDVAFLNAEFSRLTQPCKVVHELCAGVFDTLPLARKMHPGQRNSLDALCKRYSVDNSHREFHGALLDAQLLLDVYLAMTGGQTKLILGEAVSDAAVAAAALQRLVRPAGALRVVCADDSELTAHERMLTAIDKASGGRTIWRNVAVLQ
jgi:DNA polymerase III subunit epsilon